MKIITLANRKGGSGKSTLAAHLAVEALSNQINTVIIDLDPQKTLEFWWKKREDEIPFLVESSASNLENVLKKLNEKKFDLCIIDTPGDTSANAKYGIKHADLVVIPTKPTAPDLASVGRTIQLMKELQKEFIFVITQSIANSLSPLQAVSLLSEFGQVAPESISNRTAYFHAMGEGNAAQNFNKSAKKELSQVWGFLSKKIKLNKEKEKRRVVIDE